MERDRLQTRVLVILIVVLVGGWILLSGPRYPRVYTVKTVSTNKEQLLQEMPTLEFTEEELALETVLRENEELLELLETVKASEENEFAYPSPESVEELVGDVIPDNVDGGNLSVTIDTINISYFRLNVHTNMYFYWQDSLRPIKRITINNSIEDNNDDITYINYENEEYQKNRTVRVWFPKLHAFLQEKFGSY